MKVDFKITAWGRLTVPDETAEQVLEWLKANPDCSGSDLVDKFGYIGSLGTYVMLDTTEQLSVEDNKGASTVEAIDDRGVTIYTNVPVNASIKKVTKIIQ